jgi:hypothetical protein
MLDAAGTDADVASLEGQAGAERVLLQTLKSPPEQKNPTSRPTIPYVS